MELRTDGDFLARGAGAALGILSGGVLGPILFVPLGMNPVSATSLGCIVFAVAGYLLVSVAQRIRRREQDRALRDAAESALAALGLPRSVTVTVDDGCAILQGELENYPQRHEAEHLILSIPGMRGVENQIRLKPVLQAVSTPADEIQRQIATHFVRLAELDSLGVHVMLKDARIVLDGIVHSEVEASEAEVLAWNIPGVVQVENHLKIAA